MGKNLRYYVYRDENENELIGIFITLSSTYSVVERLISEGNSKAHWKEVRAV